MRIRGDQVLGWSEIGPGGAGTGHKGIPPLNGETQSTDQRKRQVERQ